MIAVNLSAVFHGVKAAIPFMKRKGWGRIINVASAHGLVASGQKVAYVAAKHGVVGMTKVAAIELANSGVTANAICPGWVRTPLVEKQLEDRAAAQGRGLEAVTLDMLAEKQPMHHSRPPIRLARWRCFCARTPPAITGAPLSIDGGWLGNRISPRPTADDRADIAAGAWRDHLADGCRGLHRLPRRPGAAGARRTRARGGQP